MQSDLIVLGKSKPKSFWHWFSRRTLEAVLEKAPCPVLVVPPVEEPVPALRPDDETPVIELGVPLGQPA